MRTLSLFLADENATLLFGKKLAQTLDKGLHIQIHGALGAGKTTLIRAVLRQFGHTGTVKSPTYNLVEQYSLELQPASRIDFYHFDFYRFNQGEEWSDAGLRDCFHDNSLCMVEWAERTEGLLPPPDLDLYLTYADDNSAEGRNLDIVAHSAAGQRCLAKLNRIAKNLPGATS